MGLTIPNHLLFFTKGPLTVAIVVCEVELRGDIERERPLRDLLPELEREVLSSPVTVGRVDAFT